MLHLVAGALLLASEEKPRHSYRDLVAVAAAWSGVIQPDYSAEVGSGISKIPPFPRWLPGNSRTRLTFHVHSDQESSILVEIARANVPAEAELLLDGRSLSRLEITKESFMGPSTQSPEGPLGTVNEDLWCRIPIGDHTLEVKNSGSGFIEVPIVRFGRIGPTTWHVNRNLVDRVDFVVRQEAQTPNLTVRVWGLGIGLPPTSGGQELDGWQIGVNGCPADCYIKTDPYSSDRYILASSQSQNAWQTNHYLCECRYQIKRYKRDLEPGTPGQPVASLNREEQNCYTRSGIDVKWDTPEFREWLKETRLIAIAGESDMDLAYRAIEWIANHMKGDWIPGTSDDPLETARRGWGHCGPISNLFIAICRANGIPARTAGGRFLSENPPLDWQEYKDPLQDHCKTEFYAKGIGWIPCDPALSLGSKDITPYFGHDNGRFVTMNFGALLINGVPLGFQVPQALFSKASGSFEGITTKLTILTKRIK